MSEILASNYSIFVSKDIASEINRFFKSNKNKYSKLFILVDEQSLKHCYPQLVEKIEAFEHAEIIEVESGEENKTIEVCIQIWSSLSEYGADRNSLFVNIGGGVISDMGGFIASTFKRGIDFINIPTTLLAQVDASVGGKIGVDLNSIKNEIGLFNNPTVVFVNSTFLNTLDKRQVLSGFAEIIKHALIADLSYWKKIQSVDFSDLNSFEDLIETSIHIKNRIIQEDPKEENLRKILNFGHTVGHALETYYLEHNTKKPLLHGEAIAIGMVCECYLSHKICKLSLKELDQVALYILNKYNAVNIDDLNIDRLIELMKHDKKNTDGNINFSLIPEIGKCLINTSAKPDLIIESLKYYFLKVKEIN